MGYGKTYKTQWLEDLSGNQGNAGQVLSTTSTGISWVDASTLPGSGIWVASGNDIYNSNSGNVGIGTVSPSEKLEVAGNIQISDADGYLQFKDTNAASGNSIRRIYNGEQNLYFSRRNDNGTLEANDMVIASSGNVGIGTTSPLQKLHISTIDDVVTLFQSTDSVSKIEFADNNTTGSLRPSIGASGNNTIFTQGAVERMRIDSSGNVGIGATSPAKKLDVVSNTTYDGIQISGSSIPTLGIIDTTNNAKFVAYVRNSDATIGMETNHPLTINTNNTERMRIDSSGNVGIGTDSPVEKMHIQDNSGANIILNSATGPVKNGIYMTEGTTSVPKQVGAYVYYDGDSNKFNIATGAGVPTDRLTILRDSGNVGIGTTSPTGTLTLFNSIAPSIKLQNSSTGSATGDGLQFYVSGATGYIDHKENGNLNFNVNSSQRMVITSSGNVGIGTTSPATKLHISQPTGSNQLTLERTGSGAGKAVLAGASEGLIVYDDVYGAKMYVGTSGTYDGNVGIGTTSPVKQLEISNSEAGDGIGGASLRLTRNDLTSNAGDSIGILDFYSNDADGAHTTAFIRSDSEELYGRQGSLSFGVSQANATDATEVMRIHNNGNVGIGTTSPSEKLEVDGKIKVTSTSDASIILQETGEEEYEIRAAGSGLFFKNDGDNQFALGQSGDVVFYKTNGSEGLTHKGSSGNVGIGTTSPSAKLEVSDSSGATLMINTDGGSNADSTLNFVENNVDRASIKWDGVDNDLRLTTEVGDFTMNPSGNVGIGTTTPQHKLEVFEVGNSLSIGDNSNAQTYMSFSGTRTMIGYSGANALIQGGSGKGIQFNVNNGTFNSGEAMRIDASGNVGIGTTSPGAKLEVNDSANNIQMRLGSLTAGISPILRLQGKNSANTSNYYADIELDAENGKLIFNDPGTSGGSVGQNPMVLDSSGNVGIGTTSPVGRFEVLTTDSNRYIRFKAPNGEERFQFYTGGTGNSSRLDMYTENGTTKAVQINTGGFSFFSNNVGIGTTSSTASALFEVASTTKGVLLPRMNTTQINAISSPAEGLTVYNTVLSTLCFFNGVSWQKVTSTAM